MRYLQLKDHLSNKEMSLRLQSQSDLRLFKYWQILYCISSNPGKRAEEYASLLGTDSSKVYRIVQLYNREGASFCDKLVWGGRREALTHLTLPEEALLMEGLKQKATSGHIITMNDIRSAVEQKTGHSVSDDYLWDLFKRHGWKKKVPRPQHPKKNAAEQKAFKKNSLNCWSPA
jgi:transposase